MSEPMHRGKALAFWTNKTPYNRLAVFVSDPYMRVTKTDHLYMVGHNEALGCKVTLHYRPRNKSMDRQAEFIVKWPYGENAARQETRTLHSTDEVEALLRPPLKDLGWVEKLTDQTRHALTLCLSYAVLEERPALSDEDKQAIRSLNFHISADSDTQSPLRYEIPQDYRRFVAAAVYRIMNRFEGRLEAHIDDDAEIISGMIEALGLQRATALSI
jgi:hypothetical protein